MIAWDCVEGANDLAASLRGAEWKQPHLCHTLLAPTTLPLVYVAGLDGRSLFQSAGGWLARSNPANNDMHSPQQPLQALISTTCSPTSSSVYANTKATASLSVQHRRLYEPRLAACLRDEPFTGMLISHTCQERELPHFAACRSDAPSVFVGCRSSPAAEPSLLHLLPTLRVHPAPPKCSSN